MWLKIYDKEGEQYPEFYKCIVTKKKILSIIKRLSKYYGIYMPEVNFKSYGGGLYSPCESSITLPKKCALGLVIHEFTHHYACVKYRTTNHRQMFYSCLCRVYRFAKEKNFIVKYGEKR
jgi:hypothetical protein